MVSYKDGSTQQPLGSSPQALATLEGLAAQFMAPSAPSPQLAVEQHVRNGRDVVSALMLDRRTSDLTEQAIDRWVATGGIGAFQPPLALPPRQQAQLQRRVSALIAQRKKVMPFANAPPSPIDAQVKMDAITRQPSPDRLHALARTNLANYLAGTGDRLVVKGGDDLTPPKAVQAACKRGLELAPDHGGDGLTSGAISRARSMAAGNAVSAETIQRIANFHSRHTYPKEASPPSPGYVAALLWGGDAGKSWANSKTQGAEKSGDFKWKKKGWVGPGGAWATAKRKAGGDNALAHHIYGKMTHKSEGSMRKAEGSRGGHITGHTKSGKPIYAATHPRNNELVAHHGEGDDHQAMEHLHFMHKDWSTDDHIEAAEHHDRASAMARTQGERNAANALTQTHAFAAMRTKKSLSVGRARTVLLEALSKAEGSRGGHIIGHTRSGKPVYASAEASHDSYKGFSAKEHRDAADVHGRAASKADKQVRIKQRRGAGEGDTEADEYAHHEHTTAAKTHRQAAAAMSR